MAACQKLCLWGTYSGKQGFDYFEGIARETAGAHGLFMHVPTVPTGGRANAHRHASLETARWVISGSAKTYWGEKPEDLMETSPGDLIWIPADVPHLPFDDGRAPAVAVIARTEPHEREPVVLLPELESLVPA